jgi:hypothetical protein
VPARNQRSMRSLQLQTALTQFIEEAAAHLRGLVASGAEVPFELEPQRARRSSGAARAGGPFLYCYRALTDEFIAERQAELERLPGHAEAAKLLAHFDGLERYLTSVDADPPRASASVCARAAIWALLRDVFEEQTDFELRPERLRAALERLERSQLAGGGEITLVATLHGLTITTAELQLTRGLTLAQPHAMEGLPEAALAAGEGGDQLIVVLSAEDEHPTETIARGRQILKELLRALRLFGDGRVTLGALAWARVGGGRWNAVALGSGGRPHGMLVVTAEQEDELRAFCNLVSRRAPYGNELAWALRRFELGCERESAIEALTDHVLALRALLEPEGPDSALLPRRVAALCATSERREELTGRTVRALALERAAMAGAVIESADAEALAAEIADNLRALLRDVICGHLTADLVSFANELLLAPAEHRAEQQPGEPTEQQPGEPAESDSASTEEIMDMLI